MNMVDIRLSSGERMLLHNMIGAELTSIKSTAADPWNRIYGNLVLTGENGDLEIRNELEAVSFFGGTEDLSVFHVAEINNHYSYEPMILNTPVVTYMIQSRIRDIILAEDEISIFEDGDIIYASSFDTAIIIRTEGEDYVISRGWYFDEMIQLMKSTDYEKDIYPVQKIVEDWTDEENGTAVRCSRREVSLRNA